MRKTLLAAAGFFNLAFALFQFMLAFLPAEASRYFGAPRWALAILQEGGLKLWLLVLLATGISIIVGLYALSGAGVVRRLPAVRLVLIALGCLAVLWSLRVFEFIMLNLQHPGSVAHRLIIIRGAPLLLGIVYLAGATLISPSRRSQTNGDIETRPSKDHRPATPKT
jgi:hypothetical protein